MELATSSMVGKVYSSPEASSRRDSAITDRKSLVVVPCGVLRTLSMALNTLRMRGPSIGPGYTVLTRMPLAPSCNASCFESALSAALGIT